MGRANGYRPPEQPFDEATLHEMRVNLICGKPLPANDVRKLVEYAMDVGDKYNEDIKNEAEEHDSTLEHHKERARTFKAALSSIVDKLHALGYEDIVRDAEKLVDEDNEDDER